VQVALCKLLSCEIISQLFSHEYRWKLRSWLCLCLIELPVQHFRISLFTKIEVLRFGKTSGGLCGGRFYFNKFEAD